MVLNLIIICFFFGFLFALVQKRNQFNVGSAMFFSIAFIIINGFREISLGEDSINYFNNYFLKANDFASITELLLSKDVVFKILNYIIFLFGSSWYYYAFVMASICLFLIIKINNISNNKNSYLFLVLLLTCPIFLENTNNILRTTMCSLIMYYGYLNLDKNKKYGLFIILLGLLTHYLQGLIIFILFLSTRLNFIKTNKGLNIFVYVILIFTILKNYFLFINYDNLFVQFELLNILMTDNIDSNYTNTQIIGSQDVISTNLFFQLLLYLLIPLYLINFDSLNSRNKQAVNYIVISLIIYVLLFPQLTFVIRLIPISLIAITYLFSLRVSKFKMIYSFAILAFNIFIAITNFISLNS